MTLKFLTHGSLHLFQEVVHKLGVVVLLDLALQYLARQHRHSGSATSSRISLRAFLRRNSDFGAGAC